MSDAVDDPASLPRTADGSAPLTQREQPGYYPKFSTLAQRNFWDDTTRRVVLTRVETTPEIAHFSPDEVAFWTVVFDHIVPQTDRVPERRVPIVPRVDHKLATHQTIGYRFADMPGEAEVYALGRRAIDEEAVAAYGAPFVELPYERRELVLERIHDAKAEAAADVWSRMSIHRFWAQLVNDGVDAYCAHPWVWDEMGFGGPAYPRAYIRLERGEPEPWEVEERRYEWAPPALSRSHLTESAIFHTESVQHSSHEEKRG